MARSTYLKSELAAKLNRVSKVDFVFSYLILFYLSILIPIYGLVQIQPAIVISMVFFVLVVSTRNKQFLKHSSIKILIGFFVWSVFSSLFAENLDAAVKTEGKLLVVIMFTSILSYIATKSVQHVFLVYKGYIAVLIFLFALSFATDDISPFSGTENNSIRNKSSDEWLMDPNTFGYYIFFALSFAFMLYTVYKPTLTSKVKLILLILFSFTLIVYTASRGGYIVFLVVVVLNAIAYFFQSSLKNFRVLLLYFILVVVAGQVLSSSYSALIKDSYLEQRFEEDKENEESPRKLHILEATKVGITHPFLGVGGGNYAHVPRNFEQGSFSHCSFTEAFANYGLLGLIFLLILYVDFGKRIILLYNDKFLKDKRPVIIIAIFFISYIIYNFFYVTYLTPEFMGAYTAAYIHLIHLQNKSKSVLFEIKNQLIEQ